MRKAFLIVLVLILACSPPPLYVEKNHAVLAQIFAPENRTLTEGDYVSYNLSVTNTGDNDSFQMVIDTAVIDSENGDIVVSSSSSHNFSERLSLERSFQVNEPGVMHIKETLSFENRSEEAQVTYDVRPKPIEFIEKSVPAKALPVEEKVEPIEEVIPVEEAPEEKILHVYIDNYTFLPNPLTITVGTTVIWKNLYSSSESVAGPGFDSGPLGTNQEFSHKFTKVTSLSYGSTLSSAYGEITVRNTTLNKADSKR